MTEKEIMKILAQGELRPIYLIAGEETYQADKIEQALLKKILPGGEQEAIDVFQGDVSMEVLINALESVPFFTDKKVVLVRETILFKERKKEDAEKRRREEERFTALLENMPPYSTLILRTSEKADKRRKLYKTVAKCGYVVDVAPIRAWEVKEWLTDKLREVDRQFDAAGFTYFVEAVGTMNMISQHFLTQEIEKLLLYTDKKIIRKADIQEMMAGIPEVSIFAMLEAVSDRDAGKALRLMADQINAGDHPLKIVTMLTRHIRQLWQIKLLAEGGASGKKIAEELKMVPFIAEKLLKKSKGFTEITLQNALLALAEADYHLKSGQADAVTLEGIIISLCRAQ